MAIDKFLHFFSLLLCIFPISAHRGWVRWVTATTCVTWCCPSATRSLTWASRSLYSNAGTLTDWTSPTACSWPMVLSRIWPSAVGGCLISTSLAAARYCTISPELFCLHVKVCDFILWRQVCIDTTFFKYQRCKSLVSCRCTYVRKFPTSALCQLLWQQSLVAYHNITCHNPNTDYKTLLLAVILHLVIYLSNSYYFIDLPLPSMICCWRHFLFLSEIMLVTLTPIPKIPIGLLREENM